MTISAKVVADSKSPEGVRIITFELRYPKFIHGELMTHRVFSRNASSSRAIPVKRLIEDIERDPAEPVHWGANQPGMQARTELTGLKLWAAKKYWARARKHALAVARRLDILGAHKQLVNRIIETHGHINVVLTTTKLDNFFGLRCHADADPTMKALADKMFDAWALSGPRHLDYEEWHLPYITAREIANHPKGRRSELLVKMSVARCARVSYKTHDGKDPSADADLQLYERLVGSKPLHASPTEHQAKPDRQVPADWGSKNLVWEHPELWGNFHAWIQYRKTLPGESGESQSGIQEKTVQEHKASRKG